MNSFFSSSSEDTLGIMMALLIMEIGMAFRAIKEAAPSDEVLDEIREAFITDGNKRLKNGHISYDATIYRVSAVA